MRKRKTLKGRPKSKLAKRSKLTYKPRSKVKETRPEREFRSILTELNYSFRAQYNVHGFLFDFYIPDHNVLVEVDGDYWHGNPDKFPDPSSMQRKNRRRDRLKSNTAQREGYRVIRFWESDIHKDPDQIKRQLKQFILRENLTD